MNEIINTSKVVVNNFHKSKPLQLREKSYKPRKYQRLTEAQKWLANNSISVEKYNELHGDRGYFNDRSTTTFKVNMASGGKLFELKRGLGNLPEGLGRKKGDIIKEYGRESRNRLLKFLLSINYNENGMPIFYTLTYPGEWPRDPRIWKRDLDTFVKRLKRKYPSIVMVWKLEEQKRGAPHYCGLIFNAATILDRQGRKEFSKEWYEVVGSGDERHLKAGTGVEPVHTLEEMQSYVAKYMEKDEQKFDYPVGRYWGVVNKKLLNICNDEVEIDEEMYFKMKRIAKNYLRKKVQKNRFREAIAGKESGLWVKWDNETALKVMNLVINNIESEAKEYEMSNMSRSSCESISNDSAR